MNTILTDDEIEDAWCKYGDEMGGADQSDALRIGREIEAAVLAKLAQQEPVAWLVTGPYEKRPFADFDGASAWCKGLNKGFGEKAYAVTPLVPYAAPQQQADRQQGPEADHVVTQTCTDERPCIPCFTDNGLCAALAAAAPEAPSQAEQVPKAWMHEEDPSRVISDVQKQQAIRDGGASASSVRPYSIALVAPEAPAQASAVDERAAKPQKWSSYFDGDERVSIYDSEAEAHGEMMSRIDSDFEPGTEIEYRVARMQDGLELLEQRGKRLGDDVIERINELLSDDMAAEEDPLDFSAEDASDLGKLIIGFARERAKIQWYTVDVTAKAKHTYVAGSNDADDAALAQKGGAA